MADYTPTTAFVFSSSDYTPSLDFDFDPVDESSQQGIIAATLDGLTASFEGYVQVEVGPTSNIGTISATLSGLTATIHGQNVSNYGVISATLDDVVGGFIAHYDPNVTRWLTALNHSLQQDATLTQSLKLEAMRDQASLTTHGVHDEQRDGLLTTNKSKFVVEDAFFTSVALGIDYTKSTSLGHVDVCFVTEQGTFIDSTLRQSQDMAHYLATGFCSIADQMTKVYPDKWHVNFQDSSVVQHDFLHMAYAEPPEPYRYTPTTDFSFTDTNYTPSPDYEWLYGEQVAYAVGHSFGLAASRFNSLFQRATLLNDQKICVLVDKARRPPRGKSPWIDDPRPDPPDVPPTGATYTVPIQEVYTMEHTKSVTLEDLTEIDMDEISLKFDTDSFAWQFNGQLLNHEQLDLIKPLPDGSPITLIVTINGYVWHVSADTINHQRQFGQRSIAIGGRGTSALLTSPNEQKSSGTQGTLLSVQQLADLHLPVGWTIDWQTVTWNVTGGAYSWQGRTPLEAIADIAAFIGAMVLPARDSKTLTIKPRYPVLPWNFAGTPVDVAIPDAAILELTYRQTSRQFANGVYVHGGEIGGVLGFARLNGTAGDVLIETQTNPLMTDVIGLRALSERLLAGDYTQPDIRSIKTEMDGTIVPLIEAGTFVGITVDGVETKGIVNGIEITASGADVEQTITLGEETNNQWTAFRSLLPKDPLLVGTITSTTGTSSIVQLIDGGVMNVRGTGEVSDKVYVRSGQIQGEAPNLVQNDIVI